MKKCLFIGLIIVQLVIILSLTKKILNYQKDILGQTSVNPIAKKSIVISPLDTLKHFYEPKPGIQIEKKDWLPYQPVYTINSDYLNATHNYSIAKPNKTYRIITLGDSFTFGQNVSTEKNWPSLLEQELNKRLFCQNINKFEVINLGVYGYDVQYAVERFKLRGFKYDPDLVIWTFTDFERILEKTMPYILEHQNEAIKLEKEGVYYKNWQEARVNLEKEIGKEGFNNFLKEQLNKFNKIYNKKLLLATLPNNQIYLDTLKAFASKRNNTYFFQSSIDWNQKEFFLPDMHFNQLGYIKMKEEIYNFIKNIIPCQP